MTTPITPVGTITYRTLSRNTLGSIRPLWEALNRLHQERSADFKEHFRTNTFERRIEKFLALPDDRLYVRAAEDSGAIVGYAVATISAGGAGEIDSIFVEDEYRARGVGRALMEQALAWLSGAGCGEISVGVAGGNEETFGFYRRFGFYPRMTILVRDASRQRDGR